MSNLQTKGQSSTGRQHKQAMKALALLEKYNTMHKFDIMNHLGLDVYQMIPFNSYLEYALRDTAEYNKQTKQWSLLEKPIEKPVVDDPEDEGISDETIPEENL